MPAIVRSRVLLPAPLCPITPTRSPSRADRLTPDRAWTLIAGLAARRNSPRTRYSLKLTRFCWRTVNVRDRSFSSILGIVAVPPSECVWKRLVGTLRPEEDRQDRHFLCHPPRRRTGPNGQGHNGLRRDPAHRPRNSSGPTLTEIRRFLTHVHRWKITRFWSQRV